MRRKFFSIIYLIIPIVCVSSNIDNTYYKLEYNYIDRSRADSLVINVNDYKILLFNKSEFRNEYLNKGNIEIYKIDQKIFDISSFTIQDLNSDPLMYCNNDSSCFLMLFNEHSGIETNVVCYYFAQNSVNRFEKINSDLISQLSDIHMIDFKYFGTEISIKHYDSVEFFNKSNYNENLSKLWYGYYDFEYDEVYYSLAIDEQVVEFSGVSLRYGFIDNCKVLKNTDNRMEIVFKNSYKGGDHGHISIDPLIIIEKNENHYKISSQLFDNNTIDVDKVNIK